MMLTFLDFFAGIGGFRLGMEMAGHQCVGHCEIDKNANIAYQAIYQPKEGEWFAADITMVRAAELPKADVWCFGFPCQDISVTQGLDIRLTNEGNIKALDKLKIKRLHFAWDDPKQDLTAYFEQFNRLSRIKDYAKKAVYVLTGFNSNLDEDLYRIYTLRDLGYDPFVMIYDKDKLPKNHTPRRLQRWVNNRIIFRSATARRFEDYKG